MERKKAIRKLEDLTPEHWAFIREYSKNGHRGRSYRIAYPVQSNGLSDEQCRNAAKQLEVNRIVKQQIEQYKAMHTEDMRVHYDKLVIKAGVQKDILLMELGAMKDKAIAEGNHNAFDKHVNTICRIQGYYSTEQKTEDNKKKITFGGWSPSDGIQPIKYEEVKLQPDQTQQMLNSDNDRGE